MFISSTQCTAYDAPRFSIFARYLSLPPGHWPEQLETDLGNGQVLVLVSLNQERAIYTQSSSCVRLTVFND